jgi:hypothetical protein
VKKSRKIKKKSGLILPERKMESVTDRLATRALVDNYEIHLAAMALLGFKSKQVICREMKPSWAVNLKPKRPRARRRIVRKGLKISVVPIPNLKKKNSNRE